MSWCYAICRDVAAAAAVHLHARSHLGCTRSLFRTFATTSQGTRPPITITQQLEDAVEDTVKVVDLIQLFRSRGHHVARLDPLERVERGPWLSEVQGDVRISGDHNLLQLLSNYPFNGTTDEKAGAVASHLKLSSCQFHAYHVGHLMPRGRGTSKKYWSLPEIVEQLHSCYCGTLAVETGHLFRAEEIAWMQERVEARVLDRVPVAEKLAILRNLIRAEVFEVFLADKFPASKRFGLEGCEAVLPGMLALVERCSAHGVGRVELGMAHRGRLNMLVNLLNKPLGALCTEMEGRQSDFHVGDVKYHLGQSGTIVFQGPDGFPRRIRLSIAPNPSHLEAVNPVVMGMVRAEQAALGEAGVGRVMGLLVHGDAAFAGLGSVAESLQLSGVPGFTTGGTVHIVINNQVGFTTLPAHARSSPHPTDLVKMVGAPVLHANADDPEAVVAACVMAADWRAKFGKDVVVDIVGYRRNGHNELDDPFLTLPLSYRKISSHPTVLELYTRKLEAEGVVRPGEVKQWCEELRQGYERDSRAAEHGDYRESAQAFLVSSWQGDALQAITEEAGSKQAALGHQQEPTGLPLETLMRVGRAICAPLRDFNCHPAVSKLLAERLRMVQGKDSRVDWAMAEALAFGTLLLHRESKNGTPQTNGGGTGNGNGNGNGPLGAGLNRGHYHVRLTGQDVERGTFNQRHSVLYDQATGARCVALNAITPGRQDKLEVWNSPLSEAAVLGFEYGYSLGARDTTLTLWEAQFGDFANNAQVAIDQFISSGEEKWGQQSGVVLLLPHGYDGQGPDHSSARMERFLQLCNDDQDHLPGHSPADRKLIHDTFEAVARDSGGLITRERAVELLRSLGVAGGAADVELAELLWGEMGLPEGCPITKASWERLMLQYIRRYSEKKANMFVVNATTPAQYFHALRRQMNLPYKKPLVLLTPKFLLHHRLATSALQDLSSATFFNRVIDDGKASDNLRHLADAPGAAGPSLTTPDRVRRVVLCSGQVFYFLWRARKARNICDVVLVRLEQIAPFPHDLLARVIHQYTNAELVWCQEEPKNMGAWQYVKPRLRTALRELDAEYPGVRRIVRYVGRPPAASPATASFAIHQKQTQEVVDAALADA